MVNRIRRGAQESPGGSAEPGAENHEEISRPREPRRERRQEARPCATCDSVPDHGGLGPEWQRAGAEGRKRTENVGQSPGSPSPRQHACLWRYPHPTIHGSRTGRPRTLSEALDHLLSGNLAACGDTLMQRFKAVELAGEAGWAVASRMELTPQSAVSAVPSEEREAALTLEGRETKRLRSHGRTEERQVLGLRSGRLGRGLQSH